MSRLPALFFAIAVTSFSQDPVVVDPPHYHVEVDNQWVRVLRVHYAPGEGSPMHDHGSGVRVFLADSFSRFTSPDGKTNESTRHAGDIGWAEKVKHGNLILGKTNVEIIELELKQPLASPVRPAPKTESPDPSETVLIENEAVRVLRAEIPGKGKTPKHSHRKSVIVTMTREGAAPSPANGNRVDGRVAWIEAGSHSLTNPGTNPLTAVIIEIK